MSANPKFDKLTPESMAKQFPVSENDIMKAAKSLISKRKGATLGTINLVSSNTKKFDTFAIMQKSLTVYLNDRGEDSVTPGGTYHSKKGVALQFHFRGHWSSKSDEVKFTMNASKTTPSGMTAYKEAPVKDLSSIKSYMENVLNMNQPNNTEDDLY
jgi:hypothetical protein